MIQNPIINEVCSDNTYHNYNQFGSNLMRCVGPIALMALPGSQAFVRQVDHHLYDRRLQYMEESSNGLGHEPGFLRDSYIMRSASVRFSSGEGKGTIFDSIRGHDCFIFCDILNYSITYSMFGKTVHMSPDDHFQDLVRMILATCDKAERLSVIMPFLYQSRQDMRYARESLDCAYMLKELAALNVKNIICFDPHDSRVENALPKKSIDNFPVSYQLIKSLCDQYRDLDFHSGQRAMIISPDEMGLKRAMFYANVLGLPLGTFYRKRNYSRHQASPNVEYEYLGDEPEGRDVIIIDDMIVTGGAMINTARRLKEFKARRVFCLASYTPLVEGTDALQRAFDAGYIDRVFSTNLIYTPPSLLDCPWYVSADMTKMAALIVDAMNHNASISSILNQTEKIKDLLHTYEDAQHFERLQ